MSKRIVAICDSDTNYLEKLLDYLDDQRPLPFEVCGFTDTDRLRNYFKMREVKISVLVIAESSLKTDAEQLTEKLLVLNEGRGSVEGRAESVNKYQQVREIYKAIMAAFLETKAVISQITMPKQGARLIGFYSPVKRAMQTTFALELGKSLAKRYKVLYISFENYVGWSGLLCREGGRDLTDLLYYLKEEDERFVYRLRLVEQRIGSLNYIPPAYAGHNLIYVAMKEWMRLLEKVKMLGGYDFILLDLSDSLQGIFDILRTCERIFTVTLPGGPAQNKLKQYEHLLKVYEYEDVLSKSKHTQVPEFETIPDETENWTKGAWREFLRRIEREDLGIEEHDL